MPRTPGRDREKARRLNFDELESIRLLCRQIQQDQLASLKYFEYRVGYQHIRGKNDVSVSSSATCVLSLVATGLWVKTHNPADTKTLLKDLISRDHSAGLDPNNPFTTAWILEAVTALKNYSELLDPTDHERVVQKEKILQDQIKNDNGGVKIAPYPASAYLTQLVVRVLRRREKLLPELGEKVNLWAWPELARQLALVQARSKSQDAFAVAYLLMLVTAVTPSSKINPEQASIQRAALKTIFDCQLEDGTWPLSRPIFHYPKIGNAHCYEYEMLTQLLQEPELRDLLLDYLPKLSSAAASVSQNVYRVEGGIPAWTSGHHPHQAEPESWATASAYHFLHALDRLLAEAIRRELFRYLDSPLPRAASRAAKEQKDFAPDLLDSQVYLEGEHKSLQNFLWEKFVRPLAAEANTIGEGRTFSKETPRSAIFFGPPGTSKTELSKKVADFLGWPHLAIDPSHLLRNGMDGMQAEANTIFRMLEETESVVVLFDEFDELVRERGSTDSQPFSRLLTTAMLPKLANIHKRATLVFIIATNKIAEFDLAIKRPGRFERVVQIMPPTYEAKIEKKDWGPTKNFELAGRLQTLQVKITGEEEQRIGDLTFDECDAFVTALAKSTTPEQAISTLNSHWNGCTLRQNVSKEDKTIWAERCKKEVEFNR